MWALVRGHWYVPSAPCQVSTVVVITRLIPLLILLILRFKKKN